MYKTWNDINMPGMSSSKTDKGSEKKFVTGVDESESGNGEKPANEVKIISAEWKAGPKGFAYNEQCFVDVKAEYLKETVRAKLSGKLFSYYNSEEIDMAQTVEGFIDDKTMVARMDIKKLWYPNNDHYSAWQKDPKTPCQYVLKTISHTRGANTLDSPKLDMPSENNNKITVNYLEIPDVHFNHNSSVPCIDKNEVLLNAIVGAIAFAKDNPEKEAVIYGHTDSSGEVDFNIKLSEERAKAIKAFLDNDRGTFVNICNGRSKVEDYQTYLSVLTNTYHWECDPGAVDNASGPKTEGALRKFQEDYCDFYGKTIDKDGKIGPQTWGAFYDVIYEQIQTAVTASAGEQKVTLKYGEGGKGVHGCGEKFAKDANTKQGRKSKEDRRVEITFKKPEDKIDETPYTGPIVFEPIEIKADKQPVAEGKIKKISAQCQHTKEGIRKAFWGETLEITPDAIGDKVTFTVEATSPAENISWVGDNIPKNSTGYTLSHKFSGINNELKNWLFNLVSGLPPFIPDKSLKISAIDTLTKDKKHVFVQIYPCKKVEYDLDLKKYLTKLTKYTDKFQSACDFLGQKIKFKYLEGKITAYAQYKEVKTTKEVFFAFGLEGGFKPIFGANMEIKFPLDPFPWVPAPLKRYVAEIAAVFELEGNLSLTVYIERSEPKKVEAGGKLTGEIVVKFGLSASLCKGKVLDVKLLIISGITGEGKVFADKTVNDKTEKWNLQAELSAEWNGLKGQISWNLFDGTWEDDLTVTIKSPVPLGKLPIDF